MVELKSFNKQTMLVSFGCGSLFVIGWWILIHTQLVDTKTHNLLPLSVFAFLPPIFASLLVVPLFPLKSSVIIPKENAFDGDFSFKRHLLFGLLAMQIAPFMASMGFLINAAASNPEGKGLRLVVEQFVASMCMMISALGLKLGTYSTSDEDDSY